MRGPSAHHLQRRRQFTGRHLAQPVRGGQDPTSDQWEGARAVSDWGPGWSLFVESEMASDAKGLQAPKREMQDEVARERARSAVAAG